MKAAIYIRVSTTEQADEGYSIPTQKERLSAYCIARDWDIYDIYIDGGYSGSSLDRPEVKRMISDASEKKFDAVIVQRLDRLSRSQRDTMYLIEDVFLANKIEFISLNESFDTSTPFGRAAIGMMSVFSQLEREQIRDRSVTVTMQKAREQQTHMGGVPPYGYKVVNGKYVIDEVTAPAIRMIYQMYTAGEGYNKIIAALNEKGYKTQRNNNFTKPTLHEILSNEKYAGVYIYNRVVTKINNKRNHRISKDEKDIIRIDGAIPAIIDKSTWTHAQRIRQQNRKTAASYKANTVYLLSGLMTCEHCGATLVGSSRGKNRHGVYYYYYECPKERIGECSYKRVNKDDIENVVIKTICDLINTEEKRQQIAHKILENARIRRSKMPNAQKALSAELRKVEKSLANLTKAIVAGADYSTLEVEMKRFEHERNRIQTELEAIEAMPKERLPNVANIAKKLAKFGQIKTYSAEDQKAILNAVCLKIRVSNDNITIVTVLDTDSGAEGN